MAVGPRPSKSRPSLRSPCGLDRRHRRRPEGPPRRPCRPNEGMGDEGQTRAVTSRRCRRDESQPGQSRSSPSERRPAWMEVKIWAGNGGQVGEGLDVAGAGRSDGKQQSHPNKISLGLQEPHKAPHRWGAAPGATNTAGRPVDAQASTSEDVEKRLLFANPRPDMPSSEGSHLGFRTMPPSEFANSRGTWAVSST